jgi:hypothetical protein
MEGRLIHFGEVRAEFLEVLRAFPAARRNEILFGEWSLKDVVAHLIGWDAYFADILASLKAGKEPPYWGSISRFNEPSVQRRRSASWEVVHDEFVVAGDEFLLRYAQLSPNLWHVRFWKGKRYTPATILDVNLHHYAKSHLPQVKRHLSGADLKEKG